MTRTLALASFVTVVTGSIAFADCSKQDRSDCDHIQNFVHSLCDLGEKCINHIPMLPSTRAQGQKILDDTRATVTTHPSPAGSSEPGAGVAN